MTAVLAIVNAVALCGRETGARRGLDWLQPDWLRAVLCFAVSAFLAFSGCAAVFGELSNAPLPCASIALMSGLGFWIYRYVIPSLLCLAFGGTSLCTVLVTLIGRSLFEGRSDVVGSLLLMGLVILGVFGALVFWLRRVARELGNA
jgi:hypothetical protein